jgi:dienelactone hydrolase
MILFALATISCSHQSQFTGDTQAIQPVKDLSPLPGSAHLTLSGDLSVRMQAEVDAFLLREIARSVSERQHHWKRDFSSPDAYEKSILPNRHRFRKYIGAVDERRHFDDLELLATRSTSPLLAESDRIQVFSVRWPVFDGVYGEGLLLEPKSEIKALVIMVPDADQSPETIAGLTPEGVSPIAKTLADQGCMVVVPTIVDRDTSFSGVPAVKMTNQSHREWVYRQAFFMGRHIIGYEVQKVLAVVDFFEKYKKKSGLDLSIGIAGYGEGGLIAFYAAAIDDRIAATWVSGYFQQRERVWIEPVYRNVYGLLHEFGDAGIADLIAPRVLIIEACRGPEVAQTKHDRGEAASGTLKTPDLDSVISEFQRAEATYESLNLQSEIRLVSNDDGVAPPGSKQAMDSFLKAVKVRAASEAGNSQLRILRKLVDKKARMQRQVTELVDHTQKLRRLSPLKGTEFWAGADKSSIVSWQQSTEKYRDYLWDEVIGRLPVASLPPNARTRLIYQTDNWRGYEVLLDVWPDVTAYGILLVPENIEAGERRPVVVTQHGRGGRPQDVCDPETDARYYHNWGADLADAGFVVFAPQNLYIGEEKYRMLQRKANPLKMTFFAVMVRQHEQILKWLGSLSFVDSERIGFYGLSYGGKSAMLIPAVLPGYALSICSGDFTETVWKHIGLDATSIFIFTNEHEHTEFDFANKFSYSDLAGLIAPRPFMVERGLHDRGMPNSWVAYEYAKVKDLYVALGIADKTDIEFFDGGHEINLQGTFDFLRRFLNRP